jgi:hypothetical protein
MPSQLNLKHVADFERVFTHELQHHKSRSVAQHDGQAEADKAHGFAIFMLLVGASTCFAPSGAAYLGL